MVERPGGPDDDGIKPRRELVESEIFEQASRLFAERGFAGTTLRDIADAVGVTRPTLYYYVRSKEEILAKLVADVSRRKAAEVDELAGDGSLGPTAMLHRITHVIAYSRASQPAHFLLLDRSEAHLPESVARLRTDVRQGILGNLTSVLKRGITSGEFRPVNPDSAAHAIYGMCNWVAWWYSPDGDPPAEQTADELAELAVAMVAQVPGRAPNRSGPRAAVELLRQDLLFLERVLDERGE